MIIISIWKEQNGNFNNIKLGEKGSILSYNVENGRINRCNCIIYLSLWFNNGKGVDWDEGIEFNRGKGV
jgi:hypothetical protein